MSFVATDPPSHKGKIDTWYTPLSIIKALGNDFDLDPCGSLMHKTAEVIYELPYACGLKKRWFGKVWLNPPYSNAKIWLDKMRCHGSGSVLIFSRTGVFGEYMDDCDHLFFFRKRIRFLDVNFEPAKFNPGSDSMILSWGYQDFSKLEGVQIK